MAKVTISPGNDILRFEPFREGFATLSIIDRRGRTLIRYNLDVRKSRLSKIARELRNLLGSIEGIELKIINNRVVVDGEILLPGDMNRIVSAVSQYNNSEVRSMVSLSPLAQRKIAQFIERDINNPEVQVRVVNGRFILEGTVNSGMEKKQAELVAKMYAPDILTEPAVTGGALLKRGDAKAGGRGADIILNLIKVRPSPPRPMEKLIQMVVHYVEFSKDYNRGFSFQWTPGISEGGVQVSLGERAGLSNIVSATISNLLPKLNWAKAHGHARVLKTSTIITQNRKKATMQATSKIPYTSRNQEGEFSTAFEKVGFSATMTPTIIGPSSDTIVLNMSFNITSLMGLTARGPTTATNQMATTITVKNGESAVVGGLIDNSKGKNYNKQPPNAGEGNPIVSLFSSKDFRKNKTQFVLFITPIIKSSASEGVEKVKRKFRLKY